jgi:hypothetical protein
VTGAGRGRAADRIGERPNPAALAPRRRRGRSRSPSRHGLAIVVGLVSALLATDNAALGEESSSATQLVQAGPSESLRIAVAQAILVQPASQAALTIRVGPADALPKNSFVRVRGLPPAVSLSEGYATAPGAWAVPLNALAGLQMIVPAGVAGRAELSISLVSEDGVPLADARVALTVQAPQPAAPARETKAQPPPPAPRAPMLSPAEREAAERFIARGEQEIDKGQVAVARQFFLRAAQAGLARGALLLAATYDPRELARWGVQGVLPNLPEARKWYERARELGAPEADERLARLGSG